jgi:hypothetical protein
VRVSNNSNIFSNKAISKKTNSSRNSSSKISPIKKQKAFIDAGERFNSMSPNNAEQKKMKI